MSGFLFGCVLLWFLLLRSRDAANAQPENASLQIRYVLLHWLAMVVLLWLIITVCQKPYFFCSPPPTRE